MRRATVWLCLVAACGSRPPADVHPLAIEPASARAGTEVAVTIHGSGFLADRSVDFGRGEIAVDARFGAWLGDTPLSAVELVDDTTLSATVPATLSIGSHDLRVRAPSGREGTLAAAFEVTPECVDDLDCSDGDACDGREECVEGRCRPGEPPACDDDPCVVSSCDPAVGCVAVPSEAPGCVPSLPPVVVVSVTPSAVTPGTAVMADASGTTDDLDPTTDLHFDWDWGDEGGFVPGGPTEEHVYEVPGTYTLWVRATDEGGRSAVGSAEVFVASATDLVVVSRGDDPPVGGDETNLTLREALDPSRINQQQYVVVVASGVTVELGSSLFIPGAVTVLGYGARIDGRHVATPTDCLLVQGGGAYLAGFEITRCPALVVRILNGSGSQVAHCRIHDNGRGVLVASAGNVFGPGNDVSASGPDGEPGVRLDDVTTVVGNRIHDNTGSGVLVRHGGVDVLRNVIDHNVLDGIAVEGKADGNRFWLNTIAGNGGSGIDLGVSDANDVQDNVLSGNVGWGVDGDTIGLTTVDYDDFHANGSGDCRPCTTYGEHSLADDPMFAAPVAGDYRLAVGSPLVDAGVVLEGSWGCDPGVESCAVDVNGPEPGRFDGAAPDIGALESP